MSDEEIKLLAEQLEKQLLEFYRAPVLTGTDLQKALGYRSIDSLRQSILRNQFPVRVFNMPNRRGKFALVKDIALYLATHATNKEEGK
jgi:hypothetical protein